MKNVSNQLYLYTAACKQHSKFKKRRIIIFAKSNKTKLLYVRPRILPNICTLFEQIGLNVYWKQNTKSPSSVCVLCLVEMKLSKNRNIIFFNPNFPHDFPISFVPFVQRKSWATWNFSIVYYIMNRGKMVD